jgi:precorrin-3B C17-methyltransferase
MYRQGVSGLGKLYVIGIGPGGLEHMTLKAREAIEKSEVIVGYTKYIDFIRPLIKDKTIFSTGMMGEEERCREALSLCKDKVVSVISTGDSGIYGMAGLILELKEKEEVEVIPGVTAASAAGSIIGAPLMHDHCSISLSDLMTPYELIKKRIELAAQGDFIISLYNPRSKGRPDYLRENIEVIKKYRRCDTPIAIVKNALREGQEALITTIGQFDDSKVDMMSIVIIGNSQSFVKDGKFITPRGYNL